MNSERLGIGAESPIHASGWSGNAAANKTLALIHICLDQMEQARSALKVFLDARPGHTLEKEAATIPSDWKPDGMSERYLMGLQQAGLN